MSSSSCFWPCLETWASWSPPGRTASSVAPSWHQNAPDGSKSQKSRIKRSVTTDWRAWAVPPHLDGSVPFVLWRGVVDRRGSWRWAGYDGLIHLLWHCDHSIFGFFETCPFLCAPLLPPTHLHATAGKMFTFPCFLLTNNNAFCLLIIFLLTSMRLIPPGPRPP